MSNYNENLLFDIDPLVVLPNNLRSRSKQGSKTEPVVDTFIIPEFTSQVSMKVPPRNLPQILSSEAAVPHLRRLFLPGTIDYVESFIVLALNRGNRMIGFKRCSTGGMTGTVADPRVIMKFALDSLACCIILCHNHPSGSVQPSRQDIDLTSRIKEAARYLDIHILDHLILTSDSFYSFKDNGHL